MKKQNPTQPVTRLNRSQLVVPAIRPEFFQKAASSNADVVLLDLEDSVAPDDKEVARRNIVDALNSVSWDNKTVSVRINAVDTPFMYRDLIDVVEQAGSKLDLIMLPKVANAADVYCLDVLLGQIETAFRLKKRIGIELQIESAEGMQNISEIAAASNRSESLHFGPGDYAASIHARTTDIGGQNVDYPGDMWHYALSRIVIASRANGLRPVDGPNADFSNPEEFRKSAAAAAALGCEGKWVIHPSQIDIANDIMRPGAEEVERAKRILSAMEDASRAGRGAVTLDGKMIDYASIRQAQMLVEKERLIAEN